MSNKKKKLKRLPVLKTDEEAERFVSGPQRGRDGDRSSRQESCRTWATASYEIQSGSDHERLPAIGDSRGSRRLSAVTLWGILYQRLRDEA
jgi:hypothetical protein